ncbi:neuronal acetylcholine receptor subunit alpha-3-like [Ruditapes philippinarum]|uniref:neuronal acetylcholine receptor subunit alpha-3-like n=1 Tax=Ruditapes philippinarum TaxID=129788 RepID=UPI00295C3818|nr:neuronal acetylcholine receptor subunit alpha-3-like [Ruditapes philippinarum]
MFVVYVGMLIACNLAIMLGQTYEEMNDLVGHLFNDTKYNKILRPLQNQSNKIQVNFTKYLKSVEYFDITTGEALISAFFEISWKDEYLTWDPSRYGGKESIQLPKGRFWKPEFELMNGRRSDAFSIYSNGVFPAWVEYNGDAIMVFGGTYDTRCNVDAMLYSLDIHHCNINIIVSNHGANDLIIHSPSSNTDDLEENDEWVIESSDAAVTLIQEKRIGKVFVPMVRISLTLRRRPAFILININTPLMLMSCLNMATCYVRPDSGERLSFAITLYLSLVLSATAAIEKIPNNSLRVPCMSYEVLFINIFNTIGVAWSIFIVNLASINVIDQRKIPSLILNMVLKRRLNKSCVLNKIESDYETEQTMESIENGEVQSVKNDIGTNSDISKSKLQHDISGREVADVADNLFFWLLGLSNTFLNVTIVSVIIGTWAQS